MNPIFLASFFRRYWKLLVVFVVLVLLGKLDQVTYFVGPLFYLIALGVGVAVVALLIKHMVFKHTLDAFTEDNPGNANGQSDFVIAWNALDAATRVKYTLYMLMALFLALSWIAASIAK